MTSTQRDQSRFTLMTQTLIFLATFWHGVPSLSYIAKPTHTRDAVNSWHLQAQVILDCPHHIANLRQWTKHHSNPNIPRQQPNFHPEKEGSLLCL